MISGTGICVRADTIASPAARQFCDPTLGKAPAPQEPVVVQQQVAAEPPIVIAPAEETPVVPVAVAAAVTLDSDALFAFDKAALSPVGQQALDEFVEKLKGIHAEMISVLGYTDRIGTDVYNQELSERRVDTVRSYLEAKGVSHDNIRGEGRGNSQPVTKAGECGSGVDAKAIACLQPDRRVEIAVNGKPVVT